jgi:hypothetical protein
VDGRFNGGKSPYRFSLLISRLTRFILHAKMMNYFSNINLLNNCYCQETFLEALCYKSEGRGFESL